MQRIDGADVSGVLPAPAATVAPGYFTEGNPGAGVPATVVTADWLNAIQEELIGLIVTVGGLAPDKASTTQLVTALGHVRAIRSAAGGAGALGPTSTPHAKALVASGNNGGGGCEVKTGAVYCGLLASGDSSADGLSSACVAADDSDADSALNGLVGASRFGFAVGEQSAVLASYGARASGTMAGAFATGNGGISEQLASGDACAIVASGDTNGADPCVNAGDRSAIVACDRMTIGAAAEEAAALASWNGDVNSLRSAALASAQPLVNGSESAVIASQPDLAGVRPTTGGQANAVLACMGGWASSAAGKAACIGSEDSDAAEESTVVLASEGVRNSTPYSVAGGRTAAALGAGANLNMTWRLESIPGSLYADGVVGAGAADYAEAFENAAPGAIPVGTLVTRQGRKVRQAGPGDRLLGVVSAAPAMIGNTAPLGWAGRFKRDEWGRTVKAAIPMVRWPRRLEERIRVELPPVRCIRWPAIPDVREAFAGPVASAPKPKLAEGEAVADFALVRGSEAFPVPALAQLYAVKPATLYDGPAADAPAELPAEAKVKAYTVEVRRRYAGPVAEAPIAIPDDAEFYTLEAPAEAPGHDPSKPYTPRHERPDEWTVVGLLGQLPIRVAAGVQADDEIAAGPGGLGVKATGPAKGARIEVMEISQAFDPALGYAIAWCLVR